MSDNKHENFKKLSTTQQQIIVGRVKRFHDVGVSVEQVAAGLNKDVELIREVYEILDTAETYKEAAMK